MMYLVTLGNGTGLCEKSLTEAKKIVQAVVETGKDGMFGKVHELDSEGQTNGVVFEARKKNGIVEVLSKAGFKRFA